MITVISTILLSVVAIVVGVIVGTLLRAVIFGLPKKPQLKFWSIAEITRDATPLLITKA